MTVNPRRKMARLNKRFFNRIQGAWAPYLLPYAVVVHRGRRSGATYRTPVVACVQNGSLVIGLPYGADSDWVRNLLAADGGELIRRGDTYRLSSPKVVQSSDHSAVPAGARWVTATAKLALVAHIDPL